MRPLACLLLAVALTAGAFPVSAVARQSGDLLRDSEWAAYAAPEAEFARYARPESALVFHAPTAWTESNDAKLFSGPDGLELHVIVDRISDGASLRAYVAALMQQLR